MVATTTKIIAAFFQSLPHWFRLLSHLFIDEVAKFEGASSKSIAQGKRAFALAAVRHRESSLLISAQEKTQIDVRIEDNPGQASGNRLHFPRFIRNPVVSEPGALGWENYDWTSKREQSASSSAGRNSQNPCPSFQRRNAVHVERK